MSCEGSPKNKALTSPYNGAEHKSGIDFFFRATCGRGADSEG